MLYTQEIWKDIEGYEGLYQVSDLGRVKSLAKMLPGGHGLRSKPEIIMKPRKYPNEYLFVTLCKPGTPHKAKMIHRLVAEAFIPNPENLPIVNHKHPDGDRTRNTVANLEWSTKRDNMIHAVEVLKTGRFGEGVPTSNFKETDIKSFIKEYRTGGHTIAALERQYGFQSGYGSRILKGKVWRRVKIE